MKRISAKFDELKNKNKKAFIGYICAQDPDFNSSLEILKKLPEAGVDIIELGIAFQDPAGDGPIIESASKRAIANSANLKKTLLMTREFRKVDNNTPIILMGYFNSFLKYGINKIFLDAQNSGVDGIIIVDLPFEEREEISQYLKEANLDFIDLIAPLTQESRIKKITNQSSGFIYLVSMLGITGTKIAKAEDNIDIISAIRKNCDLPIVIGFGIKDPKTAEEFCKLDIDGIVVGSSIVKVIEDGINSKTSSQEIINNTIKIVGEFSKKIK